MKILVSGASGFLGQNIVADLVSKGHDVTPLVRSRKAHGVYWDPVAGVLDPANVNGADAVIHLAGESVAERWSAEKKARILSSRVAGTSLIAATIAGLPKPPKVFLSASAIGYYGERGSEILTEDSPAGTNFLSQVCLQWEAATERARLAGVRTCRARFGIVLGTSGGAFPRMLAPFQLGAGGRLGTGKQYMSWIALSDTLAAINFMMSTSSLSGAINVVAPQPVTNNDFTEILAHVLHKPALFPVPGSMAHVAFGKEMADEVLLCSTRALPEKLSSAGFQFEHHGLKSALADMLG